MNIRILCLEPGWHYSMPDGPMWSWAVRELGATVMYYGPQPEQIRLLCDADVVVYFSTMDGAIHPSTEALLRAKLCCKRFVLVCTDAAHHSHDLLQEYIDRHVFDAMVNLDGNTMWPQRSGQDWTAFGMFDPKPYRGRNVKRSYKLGFQGQLDVRRGVVLDRLRQEPGVRVIVPFRLPKGQSYQDYVDRTLECRAIVNCGGDEKPDTVLDQVKGRVNEAALAGCLLFEDAGSPTRQYLTPGDVKYAVTGVPDADYLEFRDPEDIVKVLDRPDFEEYAQHIGQRLRSSVLTEYGPDRFWKKLIA